MTGKWLKRLSLALTLFLMILLIAPAAVVSAERYVALGDSISYGLSDLTGPGYTPNGYTRMYQQYRGIADADYLNLSYPGDTTRELSAVIESHSADIRRANRITISIGSNHLLGPAISSIMGLYNIDPAEYEEDLNGAQMLYDLALAVKADWTDGGTTPAERIAWLMNPLRPEAIEFNAACVAGTALFALHWPIIMTRIRLRAPLARIYVNNLYNPLYASKTVSPAMKPLYDTLGLYMSRINTNITRYASLYRYKVVNIATPFIDPANYAYLLSFPIISPSTWLMAPVTFNIPAALMIAQDPGFDPQIDYPIDPDDDFWLFFLACDPHPTTAGHTLIFKKLVDAG